MSLTRLVAGEKSQLLAVEMILAKMAPMRSAPRSSERAGAGEAVEAGVGEDFAGAGVDFAGGKEDGTGDGDGDDDGLEDDGADDPANDGAGGVFFGFGGEELLVHGLIAQQEEAGGEEELEALDGGELAEELEVCGGKSGVDGGPSAGVVDEDGKGDDQGEGGEEADGHVHVGD